MTVPVGPQILPAGSIGQKWNDSIAGAYVFDRCFNCENSYYNTTTGQVNVTLTNIDQFNQPLLVNTVELHIFWINVDTTILRGRNFTRINHANSSIWSFDFTIPADVKTEDWHQFQFLVLYRVLSSVALGQEQALRSPIDHIRITDIEHVTSNTTLAKALLKLEEAKLTSYGSPKAREIIRDATRAYDLGLLFFNNTRWINATQHGNIVLDLLETVLPAEMKYTEEIIESMKSRIKGVELALYKSTEAKNYIARAENATKGAEAAFKASNYTGAQVLVQMASLFFVSSTQVEADLRIELKQEAEKSISKAEEAIKKFQSKEPINEEARKLLAKARRELQVARSFLSARQSQEANTNATNAIKLVLSAEEIETGVEKTAQAKIDLARITLRPLWTRELDERASELVDRSTEAFNNAETAYLNKEFSRAIQLADDSLSLSSSALQQAISDSQQSPLGGILSRVPVLKDLSLIELVIGIAVLAAAGIGAFLGIRRIRAR